VLAELRNSAFSEIPPLPGDACLDALRLARILRVVERGGSSLVIMGLVGFVALAGTPRAWQDEFLRALDSHSSLYPADSVKRPDLPPPTFQNPFSVIPGGALSVEDLQAKLSGDPAIAAHFADFDFARARTVMLNTDGAFYVSYRLASGIFWTTERVYLHRGEVLLTDGASFIRARSGNRLSEVPMLPVSSLEPTAADLDAVAQVSITGQ
jgi:hypothetical protein